MLINCFSVISFQKKIKDYNTKAFRLITSAKYTVSQRVDNVKYNYPKFDFMY